MILREYQKNAVNKIKHSLKIKKTFLLTAPCAAGKTVIFCNIAKWLFDAEKSVLILIDREQLVSQTAEKIREYIGATVGIVCATAGHKNHDLITVASRQSFEKYLTQNPDLKYNLLILDECHLVNQKHGQYLNIINELQNRYSEMRILGCTATPYRFSGYIFGEGKLWDKIDYQIKTSDLIKENYLTSFTWKVRKEDKLEKLKAQNSGELKESEQFEIVNQKYFLESIYNVWQDYCQDRKTVIYALNIAHAEAIAKLFNTDAVIHSDMPKHEIDAKIKEFDKVLINVGILTIGSDIPEITAIILARKTLSTALFFQITGRGARLSPCKSDCLIIDLCGSALLHGNDPDNPILFSLKGKDEKKFKLCPECENMIDYQAAKCPQCGFVFPKTEEKQSKEREETAPAGEIVDFSGHEKVQCDRITYRYHRSDKPTPTVWVKFWNEHTELASLWLCPEHTGTPKSISDEYWREMWGASPPPASVNEFIKRQSELSDKAELTLDITKKYPKILELNNILF